MFNNEIINDYDGIIDSQSFVFTFKDYKPMKFEMKETKKEDKTFCFHKNDDLLLFKMGTSVHF